MSWLDSLEQIRKKDWSDVSDEERIEAARNVVMMGSCAAAASSMVPPPFDLVLLLPVHSAMVMTIGHIYGRKLSNTEAKRVVVELGATAGLTFAGGAALGMLKRLIPVVGGFLSMPGTFALTWGMGEVSIEYFKNPNISREELKKVFEDALKDGKAAFNKETVERFRKANPDLSPKEEATPPTEPPHASKSKDEQPQSGTPGSQRPKKRTL